MKRLRKRDVCLSHKTVPEDLQVLSLAAHVQMLRQRVAEVLESVLHPKPLGPREQADDFHGHPQHCQVIGHAVAQIGMHDLHGHRYRGRLRRGLRKIRREQAAQQPLRLTLGRTRAIRPERCPMDLGYAAAVQRRFVERLENVADVCDIEFGQQRFLGLGEGMDLG